MSNDRLDKVLDELQAVRESDYPEQRILRLYGTTKKGIEIDNKYYTIEKTGNELMFTNHYIEDGEHYEKFSGTVERNDLLDLIFNAE